MVRMGNGGASSTFGFFGEACGRCPFRVSKTMSGPLSNRVDLDCPFGLSIWTGCPFGLSTWTEHMDRGSAIAPFACRRMENASPEASCGRCGVCSLWTPELDMLTSNSMRGKRFPYPYLFGAWAPQGNPGTGHGGGDHYPTHEMAMEKYGRYLNEKNTQPSICVCW